MCHVGIQGCYFARNNLCFCGARYNSANSLSNAENVGGFVTRSRRLPAVLGEARAPRLRRLGGFSRVLISDRLFLLLRAISIGTSLPAFNYRRSAGYLASDYQRRTDGRTNERKISSTIEKCLPNAQSKLYRWSIGRRRI